MQQSETNTLAAALTTMMAGASALSTLANTDIIEVRNSAGDLKGKITAQNLAAFAAGVNLATASITDFDSANPGIYLAIAAANTSHAPISTVIRGLFMFYTHTSYKFQLLLLSLDGGFYYRVYNGTAWAAWKLLATTQV